MTDTNNEKNWCVITVCKDGTFERATPYQTKEGALETFSLLEKYMDPDEYEAGNYIVMETV